MYALLPLIIFLLFYLGTSLWLNDFYKIPITVAFLLSSTVAITTLKGRSLKDRFEVFSRGASSTNMMTMLWIFILAGAFATAAKDMGSITNTVNLALIVLPAKMIMAGIFIAACFISISIGTSVGTVVALVPIAQGLATSTGTDIAMMTGIVVGGAFFGDNLSFISDTTVVATQTQGCRMSDKFRANIRIVMPAAIIVCLLYIIIGSEMSLPDHIGEVNFLLVLPYLVVLVSAACGLNVLIVLVMGIILTGIIGVWYDAYDVFGWMHSLSKGMEGMTELIIVTMLAGGVLEVVKENGGIKFIIDRVTRRVNSRKGGELAIALLVSMVNFCTANNTVAIMTVAPIAKQIAEKYRISPRMTASILDTFSCTAQGMIPYGAQILMAAGLAGIAPTSILPYIYYPYILGLSAVIAILLRKR